MSRKRYVKYMFKAIKKCMGKCILFNNDGVTKSDALRCIRRFEIVNSVSFDPFNKEHVELITGMALHARFFRQARLAMKER